LKDPKNSIYVYRRQSSSLERTGHEKTHRFYVCLARRHHAGTRWTGMFAYREDESMDISAVEPSE
jgi:hypothetical protein